MAERGYKIIDQQAVHFITFAVVEWIDVFTRSMYADMVVESLNYCVENKGLLAHAWIIMPNHLHLIVSSTNEDGLSANIRDFKKFTSQKICKAIESNKQESRRNWILWLLKSAGSDNKRNETYQFWQQDNHPIALTDYNIMMSKLNYLHQNPVRANIVRNMEDYYYSSAIDYNGGKGLVPISHLF